MLCRGKQRFGMWEIMAFVSMRRYWRVRPGLWGGNAREERTRLGQPDVYCLATRNTKWNFRLISNGSDSQIKVCLAKKSRA
jgi:hypothetical protein